MEILSTGRATFLFLPAEVTQATVETPQKDSTCRVSNQTKTAKKGQLSPGGGGLARAPGISELLSDLTRPFWVRRRSRRAACLVVRVWRQGAVRRQGARGAYTGTNCVSRDHHLRYLHMQRAGMLSHDSQGFYDTLLSTVAMTHRLFRQQYRYPRSIPLQDPRCRHIFL